MGRLKTAGSLAVVALLLGLLLAGCGAGNASSAGASSNAPSGQQASSNQQASGAPKPAAEKPVAPETNPVGDIPDTQAFVVYSSNKGHYRLEVPEGWSRTARSGNVRFVSKLDGLSVTLKDAGKAPTVTGVRKDVVPGIKQSERAVRVSSVQEVNLPGGGAVLVKYTSNSDPNPVTGKQVRLENDSYVFYKDGKIATLRLYAPLGADNVDQWRRISESFRWT